MKNYFCLKRRKKMTRYHWIVYAIILIFLLSGCTAEPYAPIGAQGLEASGNYQEDENGNLRYVDPVASLADMDEAMEKIESMLRDADCGWEWVVRDYFYLDGNRLDARWLFGVNAYGDYLDALVLGFPMEDPFLVMDSPTLVFHGRHNEHESYHRAWQYPRTQSDMSAWGINGEEITIIYSGNQTSYYDAGIFNYDMDPLAKGEAYWNGKEWRFSQTHPEELKVPIDYKADPGEFGEYQTYQPAQSMENELSFMQQRLKNTGLNYSWEIKNSIIIDDKEYAVIWMYAVNERNEWVDVVFTDEDELIYLLYQKPEFFSNLREDQRTARNTCDPARELAQGQAHSAVWEVPLSARGQGGLRELPAASQHRPFPDG